MINIVVMDQVISSGSIHDSSPIGRPVEEEMVHLQAETQQTLLKKRDSNCPKSPQQHKRNTRCSKRVEVKAWVEDGPLTMELEYSMEKREMKVEEIHWFIPPCKPGET